MSFKISDKKQLKKSGILPIKIKNIYIEEKETKKFDIDDPDIVDHFYELKQKLYEQGIGVLSNRMIDEYRKNLLKDNIDYQRESIIYDDNIGQWRVVKVE